MYTRKVGWFTAGGLFILCYLILVSLLYDLQTDMVSMNMEATIIPDNIKSSTWKIGTLYYLFFVSYFILKPQQTARNFTENVLTVFSSINMSTFFIHI